jgi:hypothetical protein
LPRIIGVGGGQPERIGDHCLSTGGIIPKLRAIALFINLCDFLADGIIFKAGGGAVRIDNACYMVEWIVFVACGSSGTIGPGEAPALNVIDGRLLSAVGIKGANEVAARIVLICGALLSTVSVYLTHHIRLADSTQGSAGNQRPLRYMSAR